VAQQLQRDHMKLDIFKNKPEQPSSGSIYALTLIFTARSSYANAVLGIVILSVCPSVCHTYALWRNERTYCRYFDTAWKDNHSSFPILTEVGGRCLLPPEIWTQMTRPFDKRRLQPITYRKSTIRVFQRAKDESHTLPLVSKGWLRNANSLF